jgi:hypothetical protein
MASFHPRGGADASHRGGRPGSVRVLDEGRLAFADYPGNNMFNTLGNLIEYPRAASALPADVEESLRRFLAGRGKR